MITEEELNRVNHINKELAYIESLSRHSVSNYNFTPHFSREIKRRLDLVAKDMLSEYKKELEVEYNKIIEK